MDESRAVLRLLAIRRDRQSRGYGSRLIELALEYIRSSGRDEVVVNAARESTEFYRSAGFREYPWQDPGEPTDQPVVQLTGCLAVEPNDAAGGPAPRSPGS